MLAAGLGELLPRLSNKELLGKVGLLSPVSVTAECLHELGPQALIPMVLRCLALPDLSGKSSPAMEGKRLAVALAGQAGIPLRPLAELQRGPL